MKIKLMSVSAVAFKKGIFIAVLAGFLGACASSDQKDDSAFDSDADDATAVATGIDDSAPIETIDEPAMDLDTVFYFDFDQSTLSASTRAGLDAQAAALRGNDSDIRIEGHADERGSREYNLALGERRAKSVADYLAIQGISRSRIEVVSYGEERPISLRSDESAYSQNRRVELK